MPVPVNKVIIRESNEAEGVVIIDLSTTTASPLTVQKDRVFFSAAGIETTGAAEVGGGQVKNTTLTVTENGTYTPGAGYTGFDRVDVSLTPKIAEINTEAWMDQALANSRPGQIYKYTGDPGVPGRYESGNYYVVE